MKPLNLKPQERDERKAAYTGGKSSKNSRKRKDFTRAIYAADFETTVNKNNLYAYLGGFCSVFDLGDFKVVKALKLNDNIVPDFVDACFEREHNAIFYFHNLKFDYSYLFAYLAENENFELNHLITGKEKRIRFVRVKNKSGKIIEFRDSAPLFAPASVPLATVLNGWCKNYDSKGVMDYGEFERTGKISRETDRYFKIDVCGLGEALNVRLSIERDTTSLTTSSQCKKIVEKEVNDRFPTTSKKGKFKAIYPSLTYKEDKKLRPFYNGGFVYLNPKFAGKLTANISVYDINSSYPSIMRDELLPFGMPIPFKGAPLKTHPLYVCEVEFEYLNLKEGFVPFLTNRFYKGDYGEKRYVSIVAPNEPKKLRTFYLTNMEMDKALEAYDCGRVKCIGGFMFRSSNSYFKHYIEHFREMKENSTGSRREFAKLALNSPSGRWGINPDMDSYEPYLDEKGVMRFKLIEVKQKELEKKRGFYLPTSIFITAYGRMKVIEAAEKVGLNDFIYTDTDSVHTVGDYDHCFKLHPKLLGWWDKEKTPLVGNYQRQKRYAHLYEVPFDAGDRFGGRVKQVKHYTCAGIGSSYISQVVKRLEDFKLGTKIPVKRARQCKGGIYIDWEELTL